MLSPVWSQWDIMKDNYVKLTSHGEIYKNLNNGEIIKLKIYCKTTWFQV